LSRKRTNMLGPGGMTIAAGLGVVTVLFLLSQFVIPFFFNRSEPGKVTKTLITGKILDSVTGSPVLSATIMSGNNKLAEVDYSGTFTITQSLPQSPINVVAPGYIPAALSSKQTTFSMELKPNTLNGQLIDTDTQKPLAARLVQSTSLGSVITDEEGRFTFSRITPNEKLKVQLIGYEKVEVPIDLNSLDSVVTLSVRSTVLSGQILDAETGKGVPNTYISIVGSSTAAGSGSSVSGDRNGKFNMNDAPRGAGVQLKVRAPGYKIQTFPVEQVAKADIKLVPFKFQGVEVPGIFALKPNYAELFTPFLELARQGKINAIVVDMKHDDTGKLLYDSKNSLANQLGLTYDVNGFLRKDLIDVPKLLDDAHKAGLYVVARMVVYRDPALAKAKPEWALRNRNTGQPWKDLSELVWPNPLIPEVGDYNVEIAKEIAGLGFDEVQFDYIRFPTDGKLADVDYGKGLSWSVLGKMENEKMRTSVIERTVSKAYDALRYTDTYFSLDVFGYSLWLADDVGIGQQYNNLVMLADYICPMVYATHFQNGTLDLTKFPGPVGNYPGEIVARSGKISNLIEEKIATVARYRPWLEDFALAPVKHTPERVKAQIEAATTNGASGWILWNASGKYSTTVLPSAQRN